jgi:hypothetical protein
MLLSHGLRTFLALARPVRAWVARHGSHTGPVDRPMRRPGQLCAGLELRQFQVTHDLQIVHPKVLNAASFEFDRAQAKGHAAARASFS